MIYEFLCWEIKLSGAVHIGGDIDQYGGFFNFREKVPSLGSSTFATDDNDCGRWNLPYLDLSNNRVWFQEYLWLFPEFVGQEMSLEALEMFYKSLMFQVHSHYRLEYFLTDRSMGGIPPAQFVRSYTVCIYNGVLRRHDYRAGKQDFEDFELEPDPEYFDLAPVTSHTFSKP